jgi:hypothetical protein
MEHLGTSWNIAARESAKHHGTPRSILEPAMSDD